MRHDPTARSRARPSGPLPTPAARSRSPTDRRQRRRAYSWRNESPPYESPVANKNADKDPVQVASEKWLPLIGQEARCVATLVAGAALLQCSIALLLRLASFAYPLILISSGDDSSTPRYSGAATGAWWQCILTCPSIIAGCLIRVFPNKVVSHNFPGFIYASAWYVLYCTVGMRIVLYCIGRMSSVCSFICLFDELLFELKL